MARELERAKRILAKYYTTKNKIEADKKELKVLMDMLDEPDCEAYRYEAGEWDIPYYSIVEKNTMGEDSIKKLCKASHISADQFLHFDTNLKLNDESLKARLVEKVAQLRKFAEIQFQYLIGKSIENFHDLDEKYDKLYSKATDYWQKRLFEFCHDDIMAEREFRCNQKNEIKFPEPSQAAGSVSVDKNIEANAEKITSRDSVASRLKPGDVAQATGEAIGNKTELTKV
ncbi:MAG: hypothetical protein LBM38_01230 [Clostridiales bacterium]|jgi:hypothetical protein|nr:hypothetical protein [Clostridiales bacterium]